MVSEENHATAVWTTILSQLPLIYSYLATSHFDAVATVMAEAVLSGNGETGYLSTSVALCFQSPWFQEMAELHEMLVKACFTHAAYHLPKQ